MFCSLIAEHVHFPRVHLLGVPLVGTLLAEVVNILETDENKVKVANMLRLNLQHNNLQFDMRTGLMIQKNSNFMYFHPLSIASSPEKGIIHFALLGQEITLSDFESTRKMDYNSMVPLFINQPGLSDIFNDFVKNDSSNFTVSSLLDYDNIPNWYTIDIKGVLALFGMLDKPFLEFYGISDFEEANLDGCVLSDMSNTVAVTNYLSAVLYAKESSILQSVFIINHVFCATIIALYKKEDSLSEFVNELFNSCITPITREKLLEHFPNGPSSANNTVQMNHQKCYNCILDKNPVMSYRNSTLTVDPCTALKEGFEIIYHGSYNNSWLMWTSSCAALRNSREGDFNLQDTSSFYCFFAFKTAVDYAFKFNKKHPGVVVSFWLDKKLYSDLEYEYLETKNGINCTSRWGESVKGFRKNDEKSIIELKLNERLALKGEICNNPGPVVRDGKEPTYFDKLGDQICFKEVSYFKKYASLRSLLFIENPSFEVNN